MKTRHLQIAIIFLLYSLSAFSLDSTSNTNFIQTLSPLTQDNRNYSHSNDEQELPVKDILSIIGSLGAVSAIAYGFIRHIHDASQRKKREQEEYLTTFNTIISNLLLPISARESVKESHFNSSLFVGITYF